MLFLLNTRLKNLLFWYSNLPRPPETSFLDGIQCQTWTVSLAWSILLMCAIHADLLFFFIINVMCYRLEKFWQYFNKTSVHFTETKYQTDTVVKYGTYRKINAWDIQVQFISCKWYIKIQEIKNCAYRKIHAENMKNCNHIEIFSLLSHSKWVTYKMIRRTDRQFAPYSLCGQQIYICSIHGDVHFYTSTLSAILQQR